jgi:hypothetical protein
MTFGGNPYQLALALLIGILCGLRHGWTARDAAALSAKAIFVLAGAYMLFSEDRWWPAGWRVVVLASWVVTGAAASALAFVAITQLRLALRKH